MYTLSDIYMLETSHYIQSLSDQYIIESYTCESFKDVVTSLIYKIKKMFNKVKEFFKKLFGKESNNDKKMKEIEKVINDNSKLRNKKIKTTDTSKFDKIVNEANKQGKKITAKQIIAAAGITTATVGAVLLGIKKFKKNKQNEIERQEKEAIKKAENIKKEEEKKVVNNTSSDTINNKNQQKMMELQNELEKINAQIKENHDRILTLSRLSNTLDKSWNEAFEKENKYIKDKSINTDVLYTHGEDKKKIIGNRQKEYDEYMRLRDNTLDKQSDFFDNQMNIDEIEEENEHLKFKRTNISYKLDALNKLK